LNQTNMKYFPKTLNRGLAILLLAQTLLAHAASANSTAAAFEKEILRLEHAEFLESANLEIKEKLARVYWCSGKKGLAVEKWLWLNQFFRNHPRRSEWRENLRLAEKSPQSLQKTLTCSSK